MVNLVPVTKQPEQEILLNLWQLYMHDLSEFRDSALPTDGRYRDDRVRTYFAYEDHWPFLFKIEDEVAGFVMIRKSSPDTFLMGEFFVLRKFRRSGLGTTVVERILLDFPGNWEIPFQNENVKGAKFWRQTIARLGYSSVEELRPVANKPHLPHDVWLRFTS